MIAQQGQALGIQFVDAARAFAAVANQPRIFQHAQMLRNSGTRDGKSRGKLVHRQRLIPQHFKDGQAGRVAQGGKSVLYVSIHLR